MLTTIVITFTIMLLLILMMAIGAIIKGRPISGSCGGMNNVDASCNICGGNKQVCETEKQRLNQLKQN